MAASNVDWERVEADYRAGVLSLREIASAHGLSHGAINKRAKRDGWDRDLNAAIQARADAMVARQALRAEQRAAKKADDRVIVEANAERIAQIRGEHRADITRMRDLALQLLAECEAEAGDPDLFERLGEVIADGDEKALNEAYRKAISLPQRIKGVKELAETMRLLVALEREAYGITTGTGGPGDLPLVRVKDYTGRAAVAAE
jgi:TPR repeat protein